MSTDTNKAKLTGIKVENFRSYKKFPDEDYLDIGDLTILIGKNDVGKSNLLRAIEILLGSEKGSEKKKITQEDFHKNERYCMISAKFEYQQTSQKPIEIMIEAERDDQGKIQQKYKMRDGDSTEFEAINQKKLNEIKEKNIPQPLLIKAFHNPQDEFSIRGETLLSELLYPLIESKREYNTKLEDLQNFLQDLIDEIKEKLFERMKSIWGDISNISLEFDEIRLRKDLNITLRIEDINGNHHPLDMKGSGLQRSLILPLLEVYSEYKIGKGWIILFEEPEIHLHPEAQRRLFKTLRDISKRGQVIITTHSPIFVNSLRKEENHRLYLLTKEVGETKLKTKEIDYSMIRDELGVLPSDIYFSDGIIVVEGQRDKEIIESWCQKIFDDWNEYGITIIPGGGSTVLEITKSLKELTKLNKNIVVLIDGERKDTIENMKKENPAIPVRFWEINGQGCSIESIIEPTLLNKEIKDSDKKKALAKAKNMKKEDIPPIANRLLQEIVGILREQQNK